LHHQDLLAPPRAGNPLTAQLRKQILMEQRTEVLSRIDELNSCLDVLNYKIANYEQCERNVVTEEHAASA